MIFEWDTTLPKSISYVAEQRWRRLDGATVPLERGMPFFDGIHQEKPNGCLSERSGAVRAVRARAELPGLVACAANSSGVRLAMLKMFPIVLYPPLIDLWERIVKRNEDETSFQC